MFGSGPNGSVCNNMTKDKYLIKKQNQWDKNIRFDITDPSSVFYFTFFKKKIKTKFFQIFKHFSKFSKNFYTYFKKYF